MKACAIIKMTAVKLIDQIVLWSFGVPFDCLLSGWDANYILQGSMMNKIILAGFLAVASSMSFALINTSPDGTYIPVCKSGAALVSTLGDGSCPSGYSFCKPGTTSKLRVCQKL
jgi:hypothetical protein